MYALRYRLVAVSAALVLLSAAALAVGKDFDDGGTSPAPQQEPRFQVGNTLTVAAESANLMVGTQVVATLSKGQRLVVVEVRDSWIGTYASVGGQKKAGWLATANFVPAERAKIEPPVYAASETVVMEPARPAVVRVRATPANARADYFSEYDAGYYGRHETDPNVHVWEPWRYR